MRPATRDDIEAFTRDAGLAEAPTIRAWVGEVDGRRIAVGGLARYDGRWKVFLDHTDEARAYPMHLMRWAKRLMAEAKAMGIRFVYVQVDENEPGALKWAESLGFRFDERSQFYYRWSAEEAAPAATDAEA